MSAPAADLKSKEEKDAALDRRIEALRRKNQALIKRYQVIEEDRRMAEQEGIAVTAGRRPSPGERDPPEKRRGELDPPTLTVQVLLSAEEKRIVRTERKQPPPDRPSRGAPQARGSLRGVPYQAGPSSRGEVVSGWEGGDPDGHGGSKRGRGGRGRRPCGRGGPAGDAGPDRRSKEWEERRRQNIEMMNEEMEKIAEYERSQRQDGFQEKNPVRNFLDDPRRSGSFVESNRRDGSRRHTRNWGGPDFDKVKTGIEQSKERVATVHSGARRRRGGREGGNPSPDMTLNMTGREWAEYTRWKQEREQIDQERLARHRQPTGEWRREWDAEKVDAAFKEGSKSGNSASYKQAESKRPPRLPSFGEFLPEQQTDRRRKGKSRGRQRSGPSKPYSMHDNRWEKEETETTPPRTPQPMEVQSAIDSKQVEPPASPFVAVGEEEEEDQWEDVSGGEEEEEEEEGEEGQEAKGGGGQGFKEEDRCRPASPPKPPRKNEQLSLVMPVSQPETSTSPQEKPLTPFSPADGYHPVSDWGEEMELRSPRVEVASSPIAGRGEPPAPSTGARREVPVAPAASGTGAAGHQQEQLEG